MLLAERLEKHLGYVLIGGTLLTVLVSLVILGIKIPDFVNSQESALQNAIVVNSLEIASARADVLSTFMNQVNDDLELMTQLAEDLLDGTVVQEVVSPDYVRYPGLSALADATTNVNGVDLIPTLSGEERTDNSRAVAPSAMSWYSANVLSAGAADLDQVRGRVNDLFALQEMGSAVYASLDSYLNIYFGTTADNDDMYRASPYIDIDSYLDFTNFCEDPANDGTRYTHYKARCRPWFQEGLNGDGTTVWTPPYADVTTGTLVISPSRRFMDTTTSTVYGVMAQDLLMTELNSSVLNVKILDSGYAYVVNRNLEVIIHPKLTTSNSDPTLADLEGSGASNFLTTSYDNTEASWEIVEKDGENWFLFTSTVESTGMKLAVTVPESEVLESAKDTEAASWTVYAVGAAVAIVLLLILVHYLRKLIRYIANWIVAPVMVLTESTKKMANGMLDIEMEEYTAGASAGSTELTMISNQYRTLLTALRFGNASYYSGDSERAMDNYLEALQTFKQLGNMMGVASALNNIGNVHFEREEYSFSAMNYITSILVGESMLDTSTDASLPDGCLFRNPSMVPTNIDRSAYPLPPGFSLGDSRRMKLTSAIGSRYGNLSQVSVDLGDYQEAVSLLRLAMHYDRQTEHMNLYVRHGLDILTLYMDEGADEKDMLEFLEDTESYVPTPTLGEIEVDRFNHGWTWSTSQPPVFPIREWRGDDGHAVAAAQLMELSWGVFFLHKQEFHLACYSLLHALHIGPTVDRFVLSETLKRLYNCFEAMGDEDASEAISKMMAASGVGNTSVAKDKDIAFVLDYSGSMSGTRIHAAVKNLLTIYDDYTSSGDTISVITFSQQVTTVLAPTPRDTPGLRNQISKLVTPRGSTAMYDGIVAGWNHLNDRLKSGAGASSDQWVICLTDGEDNSSRKCRSMKKLKQIADSEVACKTVIISLFLRQQPLIDSLRNVAESTGGIMIPVTRESGLQGLDEAFSAVAALISGSRLAVESFM